jgi:hypothetical protein
VSTRDSSSSSSQSSASLSRTTKSSIITQTLDTSSSFVQSSSTLLAIDSISSSSTQASSAVTPSPQSSKDGLPSGAVAGIGIASTIAFFGIASAVVFAILFFRRRKQSKNNSQPFEMYYNTKDWPSTAGSNITDHPLVQPLPMIYQYHEAMSGYIAQELPSQRDAAELPYKRHTLADGTSSSPGQMHLKTSEKSGAPTNPEHRASCLTDISSQAETACREKEL